MPPAKPPLIISTPEILGGTPVFNGTRVPIQTLIDYLEGGQSIDEFLEGFPKKPKPGCWLSLREAFTRRVYPPIGPRD